MLVLGDPGVHAPRAFSPQVLEPGELFGFGDESTPWDKAEKYASMNKSAMFGLGQAPNLVPFIGAGQAGRPGDAMVMLLSAALNGIFAVAAFRAMTIETSMPWRVAHGAAGGLLGAGTLVLLLGGFSVMTAKT